MAVDAAPSYSSQHGTASGAGSSSNPTAKHLTPEELYYHVVGRWPSGYGHAAPPASAEPASNTPPGGDRDDESGRKKRRKVGPRRTKASEIWNEPAEVAFCTAVACIPPNGRTKIKFFGRPLGRNELIAQICTLATRKIYNRKQISSHSQVLKDKVPAPYKEIFTFEDKSRVGDESGDSATANVIENYKFPDAIYKVIGEPLSEDLANKAKPDWLVRHEAGESPYVAEATAALGSLWNYGSSGAEYDGYYRQAPLKDREGRGGQLGLAQPSYDSGGPYYSYSQPLRHQDLPTYNTSLPPPMPLDPQSPVTPQTATAMESALGRRYGYPSHAQPNGAYPSRLGGNSLWDADHARSPGASSQFDGQSQSSGVSPGSGVSPRQPHGPVNSWNDTKPSIPSASNDHLILPQLQDPSAWSMPSRSGVPALAPLQNLSNPPPQSSAYPLSPWSTSSGQSAGYLTQSWSGDNRESFRARALMPSDVLLSLSTATNPLPISPPDLIVNGETISVADIYQCEARYPFLYQIPPSAVPVFHIDVPVLLGANRSERRHLTQNAPSGMYLRLGLRPYVDNSTWLLTTDSAYSNGTSGPARFDRDIATLRQSQHGHAATAQLPDLAQLYQNFASPDPEIGASYDPLTSFGIPLTSIVQRVVRDSPQYQSRYQQTNRMGADWGEAACVIVYSFYAVSDQNTARPMCRQVVFDDVPRPRIDNATSSSIVADLIAGEGADPSNFGFLNRQ